MLAKVMNASGRIGIFSYIKFSRWEVEVGRIDLDLDLDLETVYCV